jgi:hypothetical protein
MVNRLSITKARVNLGQLAKRAHLNKEYFILEKNGIPVIGILDADELEDYLELQYPKVKAGIAAARREHQSGKGRPEACLLDEFNAVSQRSHRQPTRRQRP